MSDKPNISTIPEIEYLSDHFVSERVKNEQQFYAGYRLRLDHLSDFAGVGKEGSWLNSRHRRK